MNKVKMLSLVLAIAMALSLLTGCGGNDSGSAAPNAGPSEGSGQWKPEGAVTIICPYAAGGGQDIVARLFAQYANKYCGVSFVVDNITGGSATIGNTAIATAEPDGYTLGVFSNLAYYDSAITEGVTYTTESYRQLVNLCGDSTVIVANEALGLSSVKELMDKAAEGHVIWGGPEFSGQTYPRMSLESMTGISFDHMIFDGGATTLAAIMGNNCDVTSVFPSEYAAVEDQDGVVALAVTGDERLEAYPDLPTLKESGYDVTYYMLRSIVAPAGIDDSVYNYYVDTFSQILKDPDFQADLKEAGFDFFPMVGEEAYNYMMDTYNAQIENILAQVEATS